MDGQESIEMELDWKTIEIQSKQFDEGDHSIKCLVAKMVELAYQEGYNQCAEDHNRAANNFAIMMSQPAGHA